MLLEERIYVPYWSRAWNCSLSSAGLGKARSRDLVRFQAVSVMAGPRPGPNRAVTLPPLLKKLALKLLEHSYRSV
jgi:hypothetical protein